MSQETHSPPHLNPAYYTHRVQHAERFLYSKHYDECYGICTELLTHQIDHLGTLKWAEAHSLAAQCWTAKGVWHAKQAIRVYEEILGPGLEEPSDRDVKVDLEKAKMILAVAEERDVMRGTGTDDGELGVERILVEEEGMPQGQEGEADLPLRGKSHEVLIIESDKKRSPKTGDKHTRNFSRDGQELKKHKDDEDIGEVHGSGVN